jgi:hypothetical protein
MTKARTTPRLTTLILLCLACSPFGAAFASEVTERSPGLVAGRDPALGAEFSARARDGVVTVEVGLRGGKRVLARIDDVAGGVSLRSVAAGRDGVEAPVPLDQADLRTLRALHRALGPLPHRVGDALDGMLAFLDEAPPGLVLDVDTTATATAAVTAAIRPLCGVTRATGTYTLGSRQVSTEVAVGPCYNEANECLGRCGRGCRSTSVAGYSNPDTVQRFTRDCLNHDLCVKRTGNNLGECKDELQAAADDFLSARDCGSLSGRWTDNLAAVWDLRQRADFSVRGTVSLPRCGQLAVGGRHQGAGVALTATATTRPPAGCPAKVTYAGRLGNCRTARGTFAASGDDGSWRITRENR